MTDPLVTLRAQLRTFPPGAALPSLPAGLSAAQQEEAAALALLSGQPRLALAWTREPQRRAAALLRLGESAEATATLQLLPADARVTLLRARAAQQQQHPDAPTLTLDARTKARRDGDGAALIAAVTLLGELQLAREPHAALRALAEGLKVAELMGEAADPHLLAVLAHAQLALNSRKGQATAHKALARSEARGPARVLALLALARPDEALAEAQAGELSRHWWTFTVPNSDGDSTLPAAPGPARRTVD
ncbi:hypothetical protein LAJ19_04250 [Deinococcus taeanensis]|nr:hypothetical protein [Deinococcus taeanensis]UBV43432.1 hypothetical protein LAJ19_04250 [Deinococcus taeanensis]